MVPLSNIAMILGAAWTSGINLYLTGAGLGIAGRLGLIDLPGDLDVISHPLVIIVFFLLYIVEFIADKVPYVDSMWDSVHTAIRPLGGGIMSYLAMSNADPAVQYSCALLCGVVSLDAHLTKATTRAAINASPEPFSNTVASVSEDGLVVGALWLIAAHPFVAILLVVAFIVFSVWFLKVMFKFVRKVFTNVTKNDEKMTPE